MALNASHQDIIFFLTVLSKKKKIRSEQHFKIALSPSRQDITHFLPVLSKNIQNVDWYLVLRSTSEMASFTRPKSFFQRICFPVTHIVRVTAKGAAQPHCRFLLLVVHAPGDEIAETRLWRRAERNTRKKNSYRNSCRCYINLEPRLNLLGPGSRSLKQKCCLSTSTTEAAQLLLDLP